MARRRKLEQELTENQPEFANPQETQIPQMPEKQDRRRRPRVIIHLKDDGTPDLANVDPAVIESIKSAAQSAQEPIDPAVIQMGIMVISNIEASIVAPRFGIPSEQALPLILPPQEIGTQISIAGSKVLSKYSGTLGKYQDEIVLGALLIGWQISVLNNLRRYAAEWKEKNAPLAEVKEES